MNERESLASPDGGAYEAGNDAYNAFVDKFKPRKTTDDCYTPPEIYDAVADWVAAEYGLDRGRFVRPFWPGEDYRARDYGPEDVVVDNPPFSILSEIIGFYRGRDIPFFLFAPGLSLFTAAAWKVCCVAAGETVVYANGAEVQTGFVTNLEPPELVVRTAPALSAAVARAVNALRDKSKKRVTAQEFPPEVITSAMVCRWSSLGIDFRLERREAVRISKLDAMGRRSIFGCGALLSERAAARAAAARAAAAEILRLSERERAMVAALEAGEELDGEALPGQERFFA